MAGAVQTCQPVPGALYPGETEICSPASEGVGAAFAHPPGGVSKGEGPPPLPFVSFQGGPGGNRNPPGFLFGGRGGGTLLFSKEKCPPFPRPGGGHRDHLPMCMWDMVNERLHKLSLMTEGTLRAYEDNLK